MEELVIYLSRGAHDDVEVEAARNSQQWHYRVEARAINRLQQVVDRLMEGFESGRRPLADPVILAQLGTQLRDLFLAPLYADPASPFTQTEGTLLFASQTSDCLNLPWELLPALDGGFLVADGRWAIRRAARADLPKSTTPLAARPLRILFTACAPLELKQLDFEREEEGILRIADRLGGKVHLDIAEAGSFDELRDLISEYQPHVVHLSGHGVLKDGVGRFCFENERGHLDEREGPEMAECLFSGRGVRLVFVSGCQSAQAGVAGLCQSLTAAGHVPLAIGWGASIADDLATEFARVLFHELAVGRSVDRAVCVARRQLFEQGRVRSGGVELLDASVSWGKSPPPASALAATPTRSFSATASVRWPTGCAWRWKS